MNMNRHPTTSGSSHLLDGVFLGVSVANRNQQLLVKAGESGVVFPYHHPRGFLVKSFVSDYSSLARSQYVR
jgi:hypothetical protein